ncbi:MAG TPA: hypothetical protein VFH45_06115 [Acidimicrobiales bacterium]|nr:hypothetical protein [Acidimicrobiales bacterium]
MAVQAAAAVAPLEAPGPAAADGLRAGARRHGPAVGAITVVVLAFYWPLVHHLNTLTLSDGADGASFLWNYWDIPHELAAGHDPFVTGGLFHPVGVDTAFNTNTPLFSLLSWPLARIFGLGVAASLLGLACVIATGVAGYLLARRECGRADAAVVAGVAFALLPRHVLASLDAYNISHLELIGFGLLAALRLFERPTRGRAVVLGVVGGLTVCTDFTLAFFLGLAVALVAAVRWRPPNPAAAARRGAEAAATAAVVSAPVWIPAARAVAGHELTPLRGFGGADTFSADLLSWVVPPDFHPWWGTAVAGLNQHTGGGRLAYPGLVTLVLGLVGLAVARGRVRRTWGVLAGVFFVLSLGPFLVVDGQAGGGLTYLGDHFALPLPYFVLRLVPGLGELRVPSRFADVAALGLAVLGAVALARLSTRLEAVRRPGLARAVPAAAAALVVMDLLTRFWPLQPVAVPAAYRAIAAAPGDAAVLEVPLQWRDGVTRVGDNAANRDDTIFLYYATSHGHPLVSGMVARYPAGRLARLTSIPVYRQLLALESEPGFADRATFTAADLARLGIGFVVLHRDRPVPTAWSYLGRLHLPVLADDGTVVVLRVPAAQSTVAVRPSRRS